jgi:hypothetical protein
MQNFNLILAGNRVITVAAFASYTAQCPIPVDQPQHPDDITQWHTGEIVSAQRH